MEYIEFPKQEEHKSNLSTVKEKKIESEIE